MAKDPETRSSMPPFDGLVSRAVEIAGAHYGFIASLTSAEDTSPITVHAEGYSGNDRDDAPFADPSHTLATVLSRETLRSGGKFVIEDWSSHSQLKDVKSPGRYPANCSCVACPASSLETFVLGVVGMAPFTNQDVSATLHPTATWLAAVVNTVEERRRVEAGGTAIEHAQKRLEILVEDSPIVIIRVDLAGYITAFNRAAERLLGYRREEVIGKSIWMIYSEIPDPSIIRRVNKFETVEFSTKTRRKDGKILEHFIRLAPFPDTNGVFSEVIGLWLIMPRPEDETQPTSVGKRSFEEGDLAPQDLLDRMDIGTIFMGEDDRIKFMNTFMCRLLGIAREEATDKKWQDVLRLNADGRRQLSDLLTGKRDRDRAVTINLPTDDGSQRVMNVTMGSQRGKYGAKTIFAYDVTELERLRSHVGERSEHETFITRDPALLRILQRVQMLASIDVTTLVEGETGTGKELIARSLHEASLRSSAPFVAVNCANLTTTLGPSQLFGHRKGAFTGAIEHRAGAFVEGTGGTVFLDEVAEIPFEFQAALLRVLQEKEVVPLGEVRPKSIDVRVVAATNRNLAELVERSMFREDLYYRINVARIELPPLRERRIDIPLLAEHFLNQFDTAHKRPFTRIGSAAMDALVSYDWPGNVRQLKHVIESAAIECGGNHIFPEHLSIGRTRVSDTGRNLNPDSLRKYGSPLAQRIQAALERTDGNKSAAAKLLGIGRATLYRHLDKVKQKSP